MSSLPIAAAPARRLLAGAAVAIASLAVLGALMFAFRPHLSDATVALVLVVPVIVGVVVGGSWAGVLAVLLGFLLYDFAFIQPYYTLRVGSGRDWLNLVVYVVVVALVARVVDRLRVAEDQARNRETDTQRLLELSELLIENRSLGDLLPLVVSIVQDAFACESVVLLLPRDGRLEIVARAGRELTAAELRRVSPEPGVAASLMPQSAPSLLETEAFRTETIVLSAPGRPVGLIGLVGTRLSPHRRLLVRAFANHIAIALERAQLQEQTLRISVLEEVDRLRGALVGAVSHDLRTPLATIKASASTLLDDGSAIAPADRKELLSLIDEQSDRLARLVTNLLDMSRIETGSLVVDRQPLDIGEVVREAVAGLRPLVPEGRLDVRIAPELPSVDADHVLIGQVVVNLLENALRYAPAGTAVEVTVTSGAARVEVAVTDYGPGFPEQERLRIFGLARPTAPVPVLSGLASRPAAAAPATSPRPAVPAPSAGGGSGVGLAIAKAFVNAHGGTIWADNVPGGGARVAFSLPVHGAAPSSAPANGARG
ncbi:MAG: ATP-binding protein [Acidimicrobiales bacterium]|jgi:two-component system sensor histidine kinase KdpD